MKYFTQDWCDGKLNDMETEQKLRFYRGYIQKIYEKLPFTLKILSQSVNLHDGRLKSVVFDSGKNKLLIKGVFGDLATGYFVLEVKYLQVVSVNIKLLVNIFKNKKIEILSDEIEMLSDAMFSHRILFSLNKCIEIKFKDIELKIKTATFEQYKRAVCCYKIGSSRLKT